MNNVLIGWISVRDKLSWTEIIEGTENGEWEDETGGYIL